MGTHHGQALCKSPDIVVLELLQNTLDLFVRFGAEVV